MDFQKGFSLLTLLAVILLLIAALTIPIPRYQNGGCLEIDIDSPRCHPAGWKLGPSLWWQIFEGQKTVSHSLQLTPTSSSSTNDVEQDSQKPGSTFTMNFNFIDLPRKGQTAKLIVKAQTLIKEPNISIKINLPDGVELVEGGLIWDGDLAANETKQLEIKVRFIKDGNFVISGEMLSKYSGQNYFRYRRSLYVTINGSRSIVANRLPTPTLNPNRQQVEKRGSAYQRPDNYNPLGKRGLEKNSIY